MYLNSVWAVFWAIPIMLYIWWNKIVKRFFCSLHLLLVFLVFSFFFNGMWFTTEGKTCLYNGILTSSCEHPFVHHMPYRWKMCYNWSRANLDSQSVTTLHIGLSNWTPLSDNQSVLYFCIFGAWTNRVLELVSKYTGPRWLLKPFDDMSHISYPSDVSHAICSGIIHQQ